MILKDQAQVHIIPNKIDDPPHSSCHYGKIEFWEKYYQLNPKDFDWYQNFDGIKDIVTQYISKSHNILNVGCGTSLLTEEMYKEGYTKITNIDYSPTCIELMKNKYQSILSQDFQFLECDVKEMSVLKNGQFDCVIDKGCLDCILCDTYSFQNARKMLSEVSRVLADGGVYILISYGDDGTVHKKELQKELVKELQKDIPKEQQKEFQKELLTDQGPRKPVLNKPEYDWCIKKSYKIYKPNVNESDVNFDIDDKDNYHYIYVCKKGEQILSPGTKGAKKFGFDKF